jgi:hypothetical protein
MTFQRPAFALAVLLALSAMACGEEETHEHDAAEFASLAECEAHYEEEGHDAAEIAELCEGLE